MPFSPLNLLAVAASILFALVLTAVVRAIARRFGVVAKPKPYQKLIGQVLGSAFVVYYGLSLPWTHSLSLNMALTIFWLIGITNAVNLLDNMDGLAAGIEILAAGFLDLRFINNG